MVGIFVYKFGEIFIKVIQTIRASTLKLVGL